MKTHLPKILLLALMCCATQTYAATNTTAEGATYSYNGTDPLLRTADKEQSTLTYKLNADTNLILSGDSIDVSAYDTFIIDATKNKTNYVQLKDATVVAKNVSMIGIARLTSSSLSAENVTLSDNALLNGTSSVNATNKVTIAGTACVYTTVKANVISLESTSRFNTWGATLEAETVQVSNGATLKLGTVSGQETTINAANLEINDGGTLTLSEAALTADTLSNTAVTVADGATVNLLTDATMGSLTLDGGTINIGGDYTINLGGGALSIAEDVAIIYTVDSVANLNGNFTFFENVSEEGSTGLENLTVVFTDASGAQVEVKTTANADGTITANVPEPTTATLSLLALAGLAARRRRK